MRSTTAKKLPRGEDFSRAEIFRLTETQRRRPALAPESHHMQGLEEHSTAFQRCKSLMAEANGWRGKSGSELKGCPLFYIQMHSSLDDGAC